MQSQRDHRPAAREAQRRALTVGAVAIVAAALVLALIGALVAGPLVAVLAAVLVVVLAGATWVSAVQSAFGRAEERVLAGLGREVSESEFPQWRNALEGVSLLTGVPEPQLRVIESPVANAMATAGEDSGTVVVTSGLLEDNTAVEAEVIAAELLCRLRDGSARYGTLVAGLPTPVRMAAGLSEASLVDTFGEQWALREDFDAVSVTRYPPGLIAALEKMAVRGTSVRGAQPSTAALWIAPAVGRGEGVGDGVDRIANQPINYRIDALREL